MTDTSRLMPLSDDPDCREYDMECGCSLDATCYDPDCYGPPAFEFCDLHESAPEMLEVLKGLVRAAASSTPGQWAYEDGLAQALNHAVTLIQQIEGETA